MQGGRPGRYGLGTSADEMLQKARVYEILGVDRMVVSPYSGDAGVASEALELVARELLPAFE